jgi:hypothetical protein
VEDNNKKEIPKGYDSVSYADLTRFFTAKKVSQICPHCATNAWAFISHEETKSIGVSWASLDEKDETTMNRHLPVLVLLCLNCYYLWPIAKRNVSSWCASNPAPESAKESK